MSYSWFRSKNCWSHPWHFLCPNHNKSISIRYPSKIFIMRLKFEILTRCKTGKASTEHSFASLRLKIGISHQHTWPIERPKAYPTHHWGSPRSQGPLGKGSEPKGAPGETRWLDGCNSVLVRGRLQDDLKKHLQELLVLHTNEVNLEFLLIRCQWDSLVCSMEICHAPCPPHLIHPCLTTGSMAWELTFFFDAYMSKLSWSKSLGGECSSRIPLSLSAEVAEVGKSEPKMWSTLAMFEESRLPFKVSSLTSWRSSPVIFKNKTNYMGPVEIPSPWREWSVIVHFPWIASISLDGMPWLYLSSRAPSFRWALCAPADASNIIWEGHGMHWRTSCPAWLHAKLDLSCARGQLQSWFGPHISWHLDSWGQYTTGGFRVYSSSKQWCMLVHLNLT